VAKSQPCELGGTGAIGPTFLNQWVSAFADAVKAESRMARSLEKPTW
jgi:predicted dinucleotide-binding enzyme